MRSAVVPFTPAVSVSASIPSGSSLSSAIRFESSVMINGLQIPDAWTAASVSFLASCDGVNYSPMYTYEGTEVAAQASASRFISLDAKNMIGMKYLKVRSGVSGGGVDQEASRLIMLSISP